MVHPIIGHVIENICAHFPELDYNKCYLCSFQKHSAYM